MVKYDAELDSHQVEEDAGRAESLSVQINDRTADVSNEKITSPICENSVNMGEIESGDGLDASDFAFATDRTTVSERSANE